MIFIGCGANLPSDYGAPKQTILAAYQSMEKYGLVITRRSSFIETAPQPYHPDHPWYVNTVIAIDDCPFSPAQILQILLDVERELGRVRSVRNAPRLIDLDLIAYHNDVINRPGDVPALIIPHPRMADRDFVLKPLAEIAPDFIHPQTNMPINDMIAALNITGSSQNTSGECHGQ